MKFSENWLRTWVNPAIDSESLVEKLTMSGLEVEARERLEPAFRGVVVARVTDVRPHPNADRLRVCSVEDGSGAPLQIVCGATNFVAGAVVPCARVGAKVGDLQITSANLRGVESQGMLCSARELGLSDDASGLFLLPQDAPLGTDVADYLDLNDTLITLKLTPNRGDCLSVAGLAREIAALTSAMLTPTSIQPVNPTLADKRNVILQDGSACPLYCGRVIKLNNPNAQTPTWMQARLERAGLRPISPVVDVTNYVMLELGQPLHAFDQQKLRSDIVVRFAQPGETLVLLNQQSVYLTAELLVIADESGPVALGGVMGGDPSSVTPGTDTIFLEAAFFAPSAIAGRARRLGLTSDAAYRFERGVDFAGTRRALERATELIVAICGGEVGPVTETSAVLPRRDPVLVRPSRVERILGATIALDEMASIFSRLGCSYRAATDGLLVTPPSHRFDLTIEADFIEEIARIHGYENIPATPQVTKAALMPQPEGERTLIDVARSWVSRDYQEVVTYSFVAAAWEQDFSPILNPIVLRNPIAEQMSVMRTTLLGGLVETLRFNLNRKQERVRIFEIGRCFVPSQANGADDEAIAGVAQVRRIGGLCYGNYRREQWGERSRLVDFFDVKADLEACFHNTKFTFKKSESPILHPGRSAGIYLDERLVGWLGELHPRLCQKYELQLAPVVFEADIDPLLPSAIAKYAEISKFPPVRRDIAVIVDDNVSAQDLIASLNSVAPPVVREIALFDHFRGGNMPSGKKSLAFRVVMNDTEKTLTEEEIEKIDRSLKQTLVSLHQAQLRS
jgi:phenylalanyl-tRNA synthetase beta chain